MNKQQATDFILRELARQTPPDEIVQALVKQLGAPVDVVQRFVAQVAAQSPAEAGAVSPAAPPAPAAKRFASILEAKTYAEQALLEGQSLEAVIQTVMEGMGEERSIVERFVSQIEAKLPKAPVTPAPAPLDRAAPSVQRLYQPDAARQARQALENDAELRPRVLKQLIAGRKRADIVAEICEQTGYEWSEVQRYVGQVAVENHAKIAGRHNWFIIPAGSLISLAGLVLVLLYTQSAITSLQGFSRMDAWAQGDVILGTLPAAVMMFVVGVVLVAGGITSIIITLRKQMS
jgi:hypothetical protein